MATPTMHDIQGHWAQSCIERLVQQTIFSGYPDGSFQPERPVTRAEFAALVSRAFAVTDKRETCTFLDVPGDHWAGTMIQKAYRGGWLSGYPEGTFLPNQPMPRAQVLVALTAGLDLAAVRPPDSLLSQYLEDAVLVPGYAKAGVAAALEHQLVVNYPNPRRLVPLKAATRADVAAFLHQALVHATGEPSLLPSQLIAGADLTAVTAPDRELRGVWLTNVDSEVLLSRDNLAVAIDRLADCHFNTLYPTVWHSGYTLFPSAVAERVLGERQRLYPGLAKSPQEAAQANRDMLQECLELGQARGLKVMPWFEFGFLAHPGYPLRQRHPDWFTQQQTGVRTDKDNLEWFNPFHPEVQRFFLDMIEELMDRYPVDGFQVDDHFGLPVAFGYDPYTSQLYRQETGQSPPSNPKDEAWKRWRANKITEFVQKLAQTIRAKRPNAIFSVSPNPPEFSYDNYLQDWPAWITKAGVDEIVIQLYRWNLPNFLSELQKNLGQSWRQQVPVSFGVLSGLRNRPQDLELLEKQCQAVRAHGYAGMAFFFYESLWQTAPGETLETRAQTLKTLFNRGVPRP